METIYTESNCTQIVGYNSEERVLFIQYTNGKQYQYLNVPASVWFGLQSVINLHESIGRFINHIVKRFDYVQL